MYPANVQLSGKITAVKHDSRSGHVTIRYRTGGDVDGSLRLSHHHVNLHRISSAIGKTLKVEYNGVKPVGLIVGRTVLLAKSGTENESF